MQGHRSSAATPRAAAGPRPFGQPRRPDRVCRSACPISLHRAAPFSCPFGPTRLRGSRPWWDIRA